MTYFFNPARPSDGLPDLVKLAPPQSEPGVDVPGYVEVQYDEGAGIITLPDESIIQWLPEPEPTPNIAQFLIDCVPSFASLMGWLAVENAGMASVVQVATSRLDTQSLPMFIALWNTAFSGCDLDPAIATAINAAAIANNVPFVMGSVFMLSLPTGVA